MIQSLDIGKYITKFLKADRKVNELCDKRYFPIVANEGTKTPFITWSRSVEPTYLSKDMQGQDMCKIDICITSNDYNEGVELAIAVRQCLEHKTYADSKISIFDLRLTNIDEDFSPEQYMYRLFLHFETLIEDGEDII